MSDLIGFSIFSVALIVIILIINTIRWLITGNWWVEEVE